MPKNGQPSRNDALRGLPSVDELLRSPDGGDLIRSSGHTHAADLARLAIARIRADVVAGKIVDDPLGSAAAALQDLVASESLAGLRRVINATGVIVHTNLGR